MYLHVLMVQQNAYTSSRSFFQTWSSHFFSRDLCPRLDLNPWLLDQSPLLYHQTKVARPKIENKQIVVLQFPFMLLLLLFCHSSSGKGLSKQFLLMTTYPRLPSTFISASLAISVKMELVANESGVQNLLALPIFFFDKVMLFYLLQPWLSR